jgi:predicted lactoylglutathione lyase
MYMLFVYLLESKFLANFGTGQRAATKCLKSVIVATGANASVTLEKLFSEMRE